MDEGRGEESTERPVRVHHLRYTCTDHLAQRNTMGPSYPWLPVAPHLMIQFLSSTSPGSAIPPDTHGAVDSNIA
jgi:hypothetical protein